MGAGLGLSLVLAACAEQQEREWMKVNQRYTTEEFRRDVQACTQGGRLDEACMRDRGWVAVSAPRGDKARPDPDPRRRSPY